MGPTNLLALALAGAAPAGADPAVAESAPVPAAEEYEADSKWHGFVDVNMLYTSGNSEVQTYGTSAEAVRRGERDRITLRASGSYSEDEDGRTEQRAGLRGKYDYFATEKLYYNALAGIEHDKEADLDKRYYGGLGTGYQFREDEELKLNGEVGLTYFVEEFEDEEDEYVAARVAYDLDYQVSETTIFEQTAEAFPSLEDTDDFYGHVDSRLRVDIKDNLFVSLQYVLDYDNTPADGKERVDHRVLLGLGWTF